MLVARTNNHPRLFLSPNFTLPTQSPFHIHLQPQLELGERQNALQALGGYATQTTRGSW